MILIKIISYFPPAFGYCLNLCGDWTQYKDIKCFKVIQQNATQYEALDKCFEMEKSSSLITIYDQDEQKFLNQMLVKFMSFSNEFLDWYEV